MPPKRKFVRNARKKRRFHGNRFVKVESGDVDEIREENNEEITTSDEPSPSSQNQSQHVSSSEFSSIPASKRKLSTDTSSDDDSECDSGFRLVDITILMAILKNLLCPQCKSGHVVLKENAVAKMGLSSSMSIQCSLPKCSYFQNFYTSKRVDNTSKAFEVNRRAVLSMRNIGIGHQGLVKFCNIMNMLPPMNVNSYTDHIQAIHAAAKHVANDSMERAAQGVKEFYDSEDDGICDVGISADGTWRRRGYSSLYGVVSGISLVTGKVLDVEVMSKVCRECTSWSGKEDTEEYEA